jgi:hypothetical protein
MRKIQILAVLCAAIVISSCGASKGDIDGIAKGMCNCFSSMESNLSADTKEILKSATTASDPQKAISDALLKLSPEKQMSVGKEMMSFSEVGNSSSTVGKCMQDLEKKYKNVKTYNEGADAKKLVEAMKKENCSVGVAILSMGLKAQGK